MISQRTLGSQKAGEMFLLKLSGIQICIVEPPRESWSKQLEDLSNSLHNSNNCINNSSGQKSSMNNNIHNGAARNKPSNSFMGKLALFRYYNRFIR